MARFHFRRARRIEVEGETFNFKAGDSIRLFFSYRYTPERVRKILARYRLEGLRPMDYEVGGRRRVFLRES